MTKKTEEEKIAYKEYQKYIKSEQFNKLREACFERDGYKCRCCGRTVNDTNSKGKPYTLAPHHRSYIHLGEGGAAELNDLTTLCSCCHLATHRVTANYKRFKFTQEWIDAAVKNNVKRP